VVKVSITTSERGFSLIELVVVVGLVVVVTTATIGLIAALAKHAEPDVNRDMATITAQNVLERARAATAYLPFATTQADSDAVYAGITAQDKSYILTPSPPFVVSVPLPGAQCAGSPAVLALNVSTTLTGSVFDVKVTYPISACAPNAGTGTVEISETLPMGAFIPGTRVYQPLSGEPSQQ
jgi:type II secretory pathway pseudopilin PulG